MRLAWVSPLPPMPSGISDYSFELLGPLAEVAEIDAVCPRPGRFRKAHAPDGVPVISTDEFQRRFEGYDAVFYHLGNNPWHEFVYELALKLPGVAVFHDFVLHHLLAAITVEGRRDYAAYRSLLRTEHAEAGERLAWLRIRGVATDYEKFLFPLNRHVASRAVAIVVHSEDSRDRMHQVAPGVPVAVIPHHAGSPPAAVHGMSREAARAKLGLPADGFLAGHFGFITRPKQPAAVIGGFAHLAERHRDARLVMIGADNTGGGLNRLIRRHGLENQVVMTGYVDLERFYLYLRAVDAVINLRYPSAGESSGTFSRALAEGRAVIVNDLGSFAEVPADVALKVEIDGDQAAEVGAHLVRLAEEPGFRARIEQNARAYSASVLDQMRCRDLYLNVAHLEALKRSVPVPS
ncbi:MAG TPA: glycosyltransferase [Actinomycetota bacterium]|nr:glycosyltransferase [Actinomycetota bacterium]